MTSEAQKVETVEVVFAIEGHGRHFTASISPATKVREFAAVAAKAGQIDELVEVSLEDADDPLGETLILVDHLADRFSPLHVSKPGQIKVFVNYNGRKVDRLFRPNVTISRVIEWAIGKQGLHLDGGPADYQLKLDGHVLSGDDHLGQIVHGHKSVELNLVFKVKPQG